MFGLSANQKEDKIVAHFFVRFIRWQIEDELARKQSTFELGLQFKKFVGAETVLAFRAIQDTTSLDQFINLQFNCCSRRAKRSFDSTKIYYLASFLTESQRRLALELMEEIHGDYYRENLIHDFERSIAPLDFGGRDRFLASVRGSGSEQRRLS